VAPSSHWSFRRGLAWSNALVVMAITTSLVVLDIRDASVRQFWSQHSFTSSVLSELLVFLLTVLIIARVTRTRQLRGQSPAIAVQAAIILAEAARAVDAIKMTSRATEEREAATGELRTYTQMLLTSAPVLIDADLSRAFLEAAQRLAGQMFWALRDGDHDGVAERRLDDAVNKLRMAAAPLLVVLSPEQRAAIISDGWRS
jgi:hypothetical protein